MKILKFFLVLITIVSFMACSSDDDSSDEDDVVLVELTSANAAGTYDIIYYAGSSETSVTTGGISVVISTEVYSGDTFTDAELTLDLNGNYAFSGSYRETFTLTITGQAPVTDLEIEDFDDSGFYSLNNLDRTISLDGDVSNVTQFDGTNLIIIGSFTDIIGGETEVDTFEYRLVKQQ
ncbi:hypothetical protein [Psychroserpens sp.]